MRIFFLVPLLAISLVSCSKKGDGYVDPNPELIGIWELTCVLADPGDGSGTYRKVDSDKTIEFHPDGTLTSNGEICELSIESVTPTRSTYSLIDSTIYCENFPFNIRFSKTGATLTLTYFCIEGCLAKYVKK